MVVRAGQRLLPGLEGRGACLCGVWRGEKL
jgi:hypothetical protein